MDNTLPVSNNTKKKAAFSVRRIQTGWEVSRSWEDKKETASGTYVYDYQSETYAYPTLEEALDKIQELA